MSKKQPLGLLEEAQAEHAKSHRNDAGRDACPRCQFAAGAFKCFPWLEVCPAAAGAWGLGCSPCAASRAVCLAYDPKAGRQAKLARHCWRPQATQACTVKARLQVHCTGMLHKQATQLAIAHALPTRSKSGAADRKRRAPTWKQALPLRHEAGAAATIDKKAQHARKQNLSPDEKLMHGRVPQLEDWVDIWAAVSSNITMAEMKTTTRK